MPDKNKKRILIAEDETALSGILAVKLGKEGFKVSIANDGFEALKQVKEKDFDIIVLDLIMPKMDGFELLEKLKSLKKQHKIVVTSNLKQAEVNTRLKKLGVRDIIVKAETSLDEIVNKLKKLS